MEEVMKSLAELRQSPDVGLPERTTAICVAGKLVAQIQQAEAELEALPADPDEAPSNQRAADTSPRAEIQARINDLQQRVDDHLVQLRLRAKPQVEWRRWKADHPSEDEAADTIRLAGHPYRLDISMDALLASIPDYIVEPDLGPGDWDWITQNVAWSDLRDTALLVVGMHENSVDIPKLLSVWRKAGRIAAD